jgi:hypothetical protein
VSQCADWWSCIDLYLLFFITGKDVCSVVCSSLILISQCIICCTYSYLKYCFIYSYLFIYFCTFHKSMGG